ncbi:hypothetical protein J6K35_04600 [bacterium]|nr:hypothetical protein [Lachnospiraceae bacterium]MBP3491125.1 hypothetical protein [bacterium]
MKKIKTIMAISYILFLTACAVHETAGNEMTEAEDSFSANSEDVIDGIAFSIDTDNISAIQFNISKIQNEKNRKKSFCNFVSALEHVIVPENRTDGVQRTDDYDVVSVIYENGTKDNFYFFKQDSVWYVEMPDGKQYANADFITEYIDHTDVTGSGAVYLQEPYVWQLELEKEAEVFDTAYFFKEQVYYNMKECNMNQNDAIDAARESMLSDMTLYQYALKNGYGLSEEEQQAALKEEITLLQSAENYEQIAALYEQYGLSLEASVNKRKDSIVMSNTVSKLYNAKYEAFRHGDDMIGDVICKDLTEYWNTFIAEELYPEMADYDFSEFLKQLDFAEEKMKQTRLNVESAE